ncbi:MAG: c-type cytochrome [bacterium]
MPAIFRLITGIVGFGAVTLLTFTGCGTNKESFDPQQLRHMVEVRDRLKQDLGEQYDLPVPEASPEQLKRGSDLYARICASCHGGRGEGNGKIANRLAGKPSNFTDLAEATFYSEQARLDVIRKGIAGTPMMGWQGVLTDDDILAVYLYVRSLAHSK